MVSFMNFKTVVTVSSRSARQASIGDEHYFYSLHVLGGDEEKFAAGDEDPPATLARSTASVASPL
jgi:hypothetical protein